MIKPVSYAEILDDPGSADLLDEYATECLIQDHNPQRQMYEAMDKAGILHCFGAYFSGELVGFIAVISVIMPHNGKKMANIDSIFVKSACRQSGAGEALLSEAERFSREDECVCLTYAPRIGSRLATILSRRTGYKATHTVFTRWL